MDWIRADENIFEVILRTVCLHHSQS